MDRVFPIIFPVIRALVEMHSLQERIGDREQFACKCGCYMGTYDI